MSWKNHSIRYLKEGLPGVDFIMANKGKAGYTVTPFWTPKPPSTKVWGGGMWIVAHKGSHSTRIHLQLLQKFYFCKQSFRNSTHTAHIRQPHYHTQIWLKRNLSILSFQWINHSFIKCIPCRRANNNRIGT